MLKYPLYEAVIKAEDEGIFRISLVENPAVESNWEYFSKEKEERQLYSIEDEEQHIITGCFMRADYPILRKNSKGEYFYIQFSKEVIKTMVMKWMAEDRANLINQDHEKDTDVQDIFLQEVFFKNVDKGINPAGYEDVEDGSAFATYKVLDDDVWSKIKDGTFKGYSIECATEIRLVDENKEEQLYDEIIDLLKQIKNK